MAYNSKNSNVSSHSKLANADQTTPESGVASTGYDQSAQPWFDQPGLRRPKKFPKLVAPEDTGDREFKTDEEAIHYILGLVEKGKPSDYPVPMIPEEIGFEEGHHA
jgi:hypothetical protein